MYYYDKRKLETILIYQFGCFQNQSSGYYLKTDYFQLYIIIYKKEIHILLARECNLSYMLIENVFKFFDCSLLYMLCLSMRDREGKVEKEGRKKRKKGSERKHERERFHVLEIEKN